MLLKVLLTLSLACITISESLIAYYELEDSQSRHHQPSAPLSQPANSQRTMGNDDNDDNDSSSVPSLFFSRARRTKSRLCGTQLTKTLYKICAGCVKPPGTIMENQKRSDFWSAVRHKRDSNISITEKCCKEKCTMDFLQSYCC